LPRTTLNAANHEHRLGQACVASLKSSRADVRFGAFAETGAGSSDVGSTAKT